MAALCRLAPRLQTVRICRSVGHKTDDLLKNELLQRHIKRVIDEQKCISSRLDGGQVTESDRRALNLRLVEVSKVVKAFERTQLAFRELTEIQTLIHNSRAEDQQMLVLLREEHEELSRRAEKLNKELIETLVPADDLDSRSVILEVAAGRTTGGTVAECQQFRSQLQNRDTALRVLRARLYQSIMGRQTAQTHAARRQQVGTRSQSERIRTYNFSQDRVTDHRIGYVTRDIKEFMSGSEALEEVLRLLQENHEREALLKLVQSIS
uniref:Prokaryotic-type class I peptide chain release factors domain-containing protein n=1 Tax=Sinocyclocheilus rhinocerous TaxID=307959 RepID=A0A673N7T1_9TELE